MAVNVHTDVAVRLLRLEQQLDSYEKLHREELDGLRQAVAELKRHLLAVESGDRRADGDDKRGG